MRRAHLDATQSSSSPWVSKDRILAGPNGRLHPRPTGYSDTTHRKVRNSVLLGPPNRTLYSRTSHRKVLNSVRAGPQGKYRTRPVVSDAKLDSHGSPASTAAASRPGQPFLTFISALVLSRSSATTFRPESAYGCWGFTRTASSRSSIAP